MDFFKRTGFGFVLLFTHDVIEIMHCWQKFYIKYVGFSQLITLGGRRRVSIDPVTEDTNLNHFITMVPADFIHVLEFLSTILK